MSRQPNGKKRVEARAEIRLTNEPAAFSSIPAETKRHLNSPAIMPGEDPAEYWSLLTTLAKECGAEGLFDWLKVQTLAEVLWAKGRVSFLRAAHLSRPRPSPKYQPPKSPPRQLEPETKLSRDKVYKAYFAKVSTISEGTDKNNLLHWFGVSQGMYFTVERYSQEFGLERLAELVGVKPEKIPPPPPYEPPVEIPEEEEARWRAARLESAKPLDDQIAQLDREAQRVIEDIGRNLLFNLKIQELRDRYSAASDRLRSNLEIDAPSEPRQLSPPPDPEGDPE